MNKGALIENVAGKLKSSKADAERSINAVIEGIKKGVKKDGNVQLIGFGTFKMVKRKARKGRNPKTGETIKISASKSVGFKAGKSFKGSL